MNLSGPFIFRPVMTTLVMFAILFFGILSFNKLPVSDMPNVDYPTLVVSAQLPGASPSLMASSIATPLEKAFTSIAGIDNMASTNTIGNTTIVLNFDLDRNIDGASVDLQAAITRTLPLLPPLPNNPTYLRQNPSQTPILYLCLTSDSMDYASLYDYANNLLGQPLSMINGVSQVNIYGYPYAVRIQADPGLIKTFQLDLNDLSNAIISGNPLLASGNLIGPENSVTLNTLGQLTSAEGYNKLIVKYSKNYPLRVETLGNAIDAVEGKYPYFHYIRKDKDQITTVLAITLQPGSNALAVANAIFEKLPSLRKSLPQSVEFSVLYDKASFVKNAVTEVEFTLILALFLVVVVIYIYLGKIAETIVPSIVMPMSIIATFIVMYFAGFNIDILSLLALTLSIGFIVDDAIVVLENIVRHIENGEAPFEAAVKGSKQISVTVLTMTLALASVFIPMFGMPGVLGLLFKEFSVTIIVTILCSGFISLTLNPMLCSRFLKRRVKVKTQESFSERFNKRFTKFYMNLLGHSINYKFTTLLIGLFCLVASLVILSIIPTDFLPGDDVGFLIAQTQPEEGSSYPNVIRHQGQVNPIVNENSAVDSFISISGYPAPDQGVLFIRLKPLGERPGINQVISDLSQKFSKIPGVNVYMKPVPLIDLQVGNTSGLGQYQYTLQSINADELYHFAPIMVEKISKLSGITGVNSDMKIRSPQLNINIKRDEASKYGITAQAVESILGFAYAGGRISTIDMSSNQYDVILEVLQEYQRDVRALDMLYIRSPTTNEMVPVSNVAEWEEVLAPSAVNHQDLFPAVTISFNLVGDKPLGTAVQEITQIAKETLPATINANLKGTAEVFRQTFSSLRFLIILAVVVIYIVLGILYESFIHPLTVLSALPAAGFGALFTLLIFGETLSLYGFVGIMVLIGIVQKNGIILIDYALEYLKKPGESPLKAILEACEVRFRPIMMTTIAAIMGAVPIAIGFGESGASRRSLGLAIVGGLVFSQLITLFLIPVVFLYLQSFEQYIEARRQRKRERENEGPKLEPS